MADTTTTPSPVSTDTKSAIASTTIWGIIISVAPTLLKLLNVHLAPGWDAAALDLWGSVQTLIGAAIAAWGRFKATRKLFFVSK